MLATADSPNNINLGFNMILDELFTVEPIRREGILETGLITPGALNTINQSFNMSFDELFTVESMKREGILETSLIAPDASDAEI